MTCSTVLYFTVLFGCRICKKLLLSKFIALLVDDTGVSKSTLGWLQRNSGNFVKACNCEIRPIQKMSNVALFIINKISFARNKKEE